MSNFGEYLREIRGKRSLREMERITGLSHTYLSTLEKGIDPRSKKPRHPTPEVLKKLADTLSLDYVDLMKKAGYIESAHLDVKDINGKDFVSESSTGKNSYTDSAIKEYKNSIESRLSTLKYWKEREQINMNSSSNANFDLYRISLPDLNLDIDFQGELPDFDLISFLAREDITYCGKKLNADERMALLKIAEKLLPNHTKHTK